MDFNRIIDKYYPAGSRLRDIYISHCRSVADLALELNSRLSEPLPLEDVEAAAMLHDIGIYRCHAPSIACEGTEPYIAHGIIGGALLSKEGVPETIARVAERHTGTGITAAEIESHGLPIPIADYIPETMLEKLICYADKFFSKSGDMKRKEFSKVRAGMSKFGADSVARFDALVALFGRV